MVDTIRDTFKAIDIKGLKQINEYIIKKEIIKKRMWIRHCFVHGGKAVEAVLYLIFIASNIMQLFLFRRLRKYFSTQREIVRLLLKALYMMKYKSELVFNST